MVIPLWNKETPRFDPSVGQREPGLTPCLCEGAKGCVIVLPGGGYAMRAEHEGMPVAERLCRGGISAFVLSYRVAPYRAPVPLMDARRAVRLVRANAAQLGIEKIGILGFSAGGHLAGSAALMEDGWAGDPANADPVERESARPDAAVLCYPVVSMQRCTHAGSRENLLGERADDPAARAAHSLELLAGRQAPPCFLWHTADDASVLVQNSLALASRLAENGTPFELHVYPNGRHGLGLAAGMPPVSEWSDACVRWLHALGF